MKAVRIAIVVALFGAISLGSIVAQEKGKAKGTLPQGWGKLGLSEEQKTKIYDIQAKGKAKLEDLEKQIKDLKEKIHKDELAVLTDAQRKKLKDMALEKAGGDSGKN